MTLDTSTDAYVHEELLRKCNLVTTKPTLYIRSVQFHTQDLYFGEKRDRGMNVLGAYSANPS